MLFDRVIAVRNTKTVYRDGSRCLKVFNQEHTQAEVLGEARNQSLAEAAGLPVPRVLEVTSVQGKWAIVSEFIRGKTLEQLLQEHPEKRGEFFSLLAELQREIQAKECPSLGWMQTEMKRRIGRAPLSESERAALLERLHSLPCGSQMCHGDFAPSNVIVAPDGKAWCVGWARLTGGSAAADAAGTWLRLCLESGREAAEEYLDIYCRKSRTERKRIDDWIPLVAASGLTEANARERAFLLPQAIGGTKEKNR